MGQHKHSAGPRAGTQKPPAFRLGASRFRGNLNIVLTVVWLGVIELAVVTDHVFLTLIAHILKLQFVTVQYLLIENRVIRVFANYRH